MIHSSEIFTPVASLYHVISNSTVSVPTPSHNTIPSQRNPPLSTRACHFRNK